MKFFAEMMYLIAALLFVTGIKRMSNPETARVGNLISSSGMLLAVVATLLEFKVLDYTYIIGGLVVGAAIGATLAHVVKMTEMPQMVALLNGYGGIASLLVAWAEFYRKYSTPETNFFSQSTDSFTAGVIALTIIIGGITFSGSVIAWAKLRGVLSGKPVLFRGQQVLNALLLLILITGGVLFALSPVNTLPIIIAVSVIALVLGVTTVMAIGGADMPVVISLLNSYSGVAASFAGFVVQNNVLIVTGALVGASGLILTNIMCKAMNRSLVNVLFSGFGGVTVQKTDTKKEKVKPISVEDAYVLLEAAHSVVIVPGYGMAVAQAQHVVRELADQLEKNNTDVKFAIHPVAGRMPGHMNVLLAEANVSYEQLYEMEAINPLMETVDVCLVIGANDVVNPAAREDKNSPIYGMPIINADKAKTVIVMKRSMASGFAGIDNPLFYKDNTRMLFGDAKNVLQALVAEFKK